MNNIIDGGMKQMKKKLKCTEKMDTTVKGTRE